MLAVTHSTCRRVPRRLVMFWATPSARRCHDAIVPSVVLSVMPSARRFHTYGAIDPSVTSSATPSVTLPGRGNDIGPSATSSAIR